MAIRLLLSVIAALYIAFSSRQIRAWCESESEARSALGPEVATVLIHRLADIDAAPSAADLIVGHPACGADSNEGHWKIPLANGYMLALCVGHPDIPQNADGTVDWSRVRRVKILGIEPVNG